MQGSAAGHIFKGMGEVSLASGKQGIGNTEILHRMSRFGQPCEDGQRTSYDKSSVQGGHASSRLPFPGLMVASAKSGHSRTSNKEATSDIIPSLHGHRGLMQPTNAKILQKATLKIDFYLIPIVAMFCVLITPSDLLSFLVSASVITPLEVLTAAKWLQDRSYDMSLCSNSFIHLIRPKGTSVMLG